MATSRAFAAGLALEPHKAAALSRGPLAVPAPDLAIVALDQGAGVAARPLVQVGDVVRRGTPLAASDDPAGATVHSPVSGRVRSVELRTLSDERGQGPCVLIENDGSDAADPRNEPLGDYAGLAPDTLLARIREGGIAGLGGAAFATATKLASARSHGATHLVLNAAECEPWICCDDALLRLRADDVVFGAQVLMHASGTTRCTIAVEDDKPEAVAALRDALARASDARLGLSILRAIYPAGAERQLLTAVTGTEVPSGELPAAAGLLCQNVGTAAAVARLVRNGEPCTSRILTLTGSGVAQPANVEAAIGTTIEHLVRACGGYAGQPLRLIAGGSMTGRALATDAVPVTKALNCVIVATAADLVPRGTEVPCIRCGDCATVCPAGLLPQQLHRAVLAGDADAARRFGLVDCIECGCCDYVCPSRIPLTHRFHAGRLELRRRDDEALQARLARERYERHERRLEEAAAAERAAFEAARRRARSEDESRGREP